MSTDVQTTELPAIGAHPLRDWPNTLDNFVPALHFDERASIQLLRAVEFASRIGKLDQLLGRLHHLTDFVRPRPEDSADPYRYNHTLRRVTLYEDFAPFSFTFMEQSRKKGESGWKRDGFLGGLIYQGPDCPADGSFPSLTVSLNSGTGWFIHT